MRLWYLCVSINESIKHLGSRRNRVADYNIIQARLHLLIKHLLYGYLFNYSYNCVDDTETLFIHWIIQLDR